ncbi:hypothetical protein Bca101_010158 [Brassica carinata]
MRSIPILQIFYKGRLYSRKPTLQSTRVYPTEATSKQQDKREGPYNLSGFLNGSASNLQAPRRNTMQTPASGSPDENPYSLQIAKEDSARSFQVLGKRDTSTDTTGPCKQHVQEFYSCTKNRPGYLLISGLHMPKVLPTRYQGTILRQCKKLQIQHQNLKEHQGDQKRRPE